MFPDPTNGFLQFPPRTLLFSGTPTRHSTPLSSAHRQRFLMTRGSRLLLGASSARRRQQKNQRLPDFGTARHSHSPGQSRRMPALRWRITRLPGAPPSLSGTVLPHGVKLDLWTMHLQGGAHSEQLPEATGKKNQKKRPQSRPGLPQRGPRDTWHSTHRTTDKVAEAKEAASCTRTGGGRRVSETPAGKFWCCASKTSTHTHMRKTPYGLVFFVYSGGGDLWRVATLAIAL